MAWVIGLAGPDEIEAMRRKGWEVETDPVKVQEAATKDPEREEDGDCIVAVFVDCDVPDLLG